MKKISGSRWPYTAPVQTAQQQQQQMHPIQIKPFTGGAAGARQKAIRKKAGKRILRRGEASIEEQAQTKHPIRICYR